jgi:hypothetical protein
MWDTILYSTSISELSKYIDIANSYISVSNPFCIIFILDLFILLHLTDNIFCNTRPNVSSP